MKHLITAAILSALLAHPALAQTKEKGPWWPNEQWGAGDQSGGSNWITPAKVLEAVKLVKTGKVYEIGQVYERGMPLFGDRTYAIFTHQGGPFGTNDLMYHDEFVTAEIGQVGTQFDGLGHIGKRMKMADGSTKDVYYNGYTEQDDLYSPYGLLQLGVEKIKPFITRGVLVDVAGYKGVDTLPNAYEVTLADVKGALKKQGIDENSFKPGDAILFNYGWSKLWTDPAKYNVDPPGIGVEVGHWIVDQKVSMVGADTWPTEVFDSSAPTMAPVHQILITENGIMNLENMVFDSLIEDGVYEFLFVFTPLRLKGGTGSPARPLAIR